MARVNSGCMDALSKSARNCAAPRPAVVVRAPATAGGRVLDAHRDGDVRRMGRRARRDDHPPMDSARRLQPAHPDPAPQPVHPHTRRPTLSRSSTPRCTTASCDPSSPATSHRRRLRSVPPSASSTANSPAASPPRGSQPPPDQPRLAPHPAKPTGKLKTNVKVLTTKLR